MPLIPIPGLYHVLARKQKALDWKRGQIAVADKDAHTDPRCEHEDKLLAEKQRSAAAALAKHIQEDEQIVDGIEVMIHALRSSDHQSAYRTLAMRQLETASMLIRRELGDPV